MTELGKDAPEPSKIFHADRPMITNRQTSKDGTIKWLIRRDDGQEAEMVYIPEDDRGHYVSQVKLDALDMLILPYRHTKLMHNLTAK